MSDKNNGLHENKVETGTIALTFDLELFSHANAQSIREISAIKQEYLISEIDFMLDLCDRMGLKATFFVVGELTKKYAKEIQKIHSAGHEIASHSNSHRLLYTLPSDELYKEIFDSKKALEDCVGDDVLGFRAPSWSISKAMVKNYYSMLADAGYRYSSSVFPGKNFLYGIPDAPKSIHLAKYDIVEFPMPTVSVCGKSIGYTGGFYYRLLPYFVTKCLINRNINKGEKLFLYYHPWEFNINKYKFKASLLDKTILSLNRKILYSRVRKLFGDGSLVSIRMADMLFAKE